MKQATKNVNKYAEEIKEIFNTIMSTTIYSCKNSDPQIASEAREINSGAHKGSKLVDRLISEYRREKQG